jgi:hypothetical protein
MHYHWAKLYLQSYVLRGLPDSGAIIPEHFLENASSAVQAAIAIINLLLDDKDAQIAIGFVPHHVHGMVAFAAMFLLKVATRHSEQLFVLVDKAMFQRLIGGLAGHFAGIDVGKDHLLHRMAEGLEKMSESLGGPVRTSGKARGARHVSRPSQDDYPRSTLDTNATGSAGGNVNPVNTTLTNGTDMQHANGGGGGGGYGQVSDQNAFDFGDPALGLGMPFFDFEGTTLNGSSLWDFN